MDADRHDQPAATPYNGGHDERVSARNLGQGDHSAVEAEAASPRFSAPSGREVARPDVPDPVAHSDSAAPIQELDVVKLTGTVVSLHGGVASVELSDAEGRTLTLVDIRIRDLEAMRDAD